MNRIEVLAITAVIAAIAVPGAVWAQAYKWRDEKGQVVYSDQPPPKNIPPGNVLQAPKPSALARAAAATAASSGAAVSAPAGKPAAKPAAAPKSTAEQEADYKKRQLESQKKAKEDGDKAAQEQQRLAACASMRQSLAGLEGGQRVSRTDDKGERYFINDEQRAGDIARAKQEMAAAKC